MKRAMYFITRKGKMYPGVRLTHSFIYENLTADARRNPRAAVCARIGTASRSRHLPSRSCPQPIREVKPYGRNP